MADLLNLRITVDTRAAERMQASIKTPMPKAAGCLIEANSAIADIPFSVTVKKGRKG